MAFEEINFHDMHTEAGPQIIYSDAFDVGAYRSLVGAVNVNTFAGTNLAVTIETSLEGRVWVNAAVIPPFAGPGTTPFAIVVDQGHTLLRYVRAKQELTGATVQTTYSVRAIARD